MAKTHGNPQAFIRNATIACIAKRRRLIVIAKSTDKVGFPFGWNAFRISAARGPLAVQGIPFMRKIVLAAAAAGAALALSACSSEKAEDAAATASDAATDAAAAATEAATDAAAAATDAAAAASGAATDAAAAASGAADAAAAAASDAAKKM
jgi:hypothetical protein